MCSFSRTLERLARNVKPLNAFDFTSLGLTAALPIPLRPMPSKAFTGYSQPRNTPENCRPSLNSQLARQNLRSMRCPRKNASPHCTKSCHPPVDALHSIENKSDRVALFSLTQNLKGVQQDRSLTVS
jgi:hypothetical protein